MLDSWLLGSTNPATPGVFVVRGGERMSEIRRQARPDLYLRDVALTEGVVVETYADHATVEFVGETGETLALLDCPYTILTGITYLTLDDDERCPTCGEPGCM